MKSTIPMMNLLKPVVEAVSALGWNLDQREILFKEILLLFLFTRLT